MLSGVEVTVIGYSGTTVAQLSRRISGNVIPLNADVIFLHVGENNYEQQQRRATAQETSSIWRWTWCTCTGLAVS